LRVERAGFGKVAPGGDRQFLGRIAERRAAALHPVVLFDDPMSRGNVFRDDPARSKGHGSQQPSKRVGDADVMTRSAGGRIAHSESLEAKVNKP
jgi:hypothetical protein